MDTSAAQRIPAPPADVFAYATDPSNEPDWIDGVQAARQLTEGELQVGTRTERTASFLGKDITYVLEVTELEPPHRIRMVSVEGPFPMDVTYLFQPAEGSATEASIHLAGGPTGIARLAAPLIRRMSRRGIEKDLAHLAERFG